MLLQLASPSFVPFTKRRTLTEPSNVYAKEAVIAQHLILTKKGSQARLPCKEHKLKMRDWHGGLHEGLENAPPSRSHAARLGTLPADIDQLTSQLPHFRQDEAVL